MQITLVQNEIEQALKNYINDIMSVKEGMEITITMKATRGDEGNTAIIDIMPIGSTAPVVTAPAKTVAKTTAKKATKAVEPEPVEVEEPEEEEVAETPKEPEEEAAPEEEPVEQDPEPQEKEAEPAAKPASLFSNLRKPKN